MFGLIPIPGTTKPAAPVTEAPVTIEAGKARAAAQTRAKAAAAHAAHPTMKSPYVNELEPNQVITTSFLVHSKEIRQKKTGELYLSLLLGDRTGELDAKMWDNVAEVLDSFDRDDFVKVKGLIQIFHNRPQLTIHKVRRMDDSEVDFADYFPSSRARSGGDVGGAARHGGGHRQSAPEGAAGSAAGRRGHRAPVSAARRPPSRSTMPTWAA